MEQIHNEILKANPNEHNGYMVIEHINELDQDNIVAMGRIEQKEQEYEVQKKGR